MDRIKYLITHSFTKEREPGRSGADDCRTPNEYRRTSNWCKFISAWKAVRRYLGLYHRLLDTQQGEEIAEIQRARDDRCGHGSFGENRRSPRPNSITLNTRTLWPRNHCLWNSNSPHPTKLSIWFGRMSRKSRSISNRPDFYAVEGYYPASFVQIVCGRRCIGRRKSGHCWRGDVPCEEVVRLLVPVIVLYQESVAGRTASVRSDNAA